MRDQRREYCGRIGDAAMSQQFAQFDQRIALTFRGQRGMRREMHSCRDNYFIRRVFHDHRQQHHRVDNLFRRISGHFLHQGRTCAGLGPRDDVGVEFGQRPDVVLVDLFAVKHEAVPQHVEQGIILKRSPLAAVQIKPHFLR